MTVEFLKQKIDLARLPMVERAIFNSSKNNHTEYLPKTRIELLGQIEEWARSLDGKRIFWLNGMAGTGKSTVSQTVARRLEQKHSLGATFPSNKAKKIKAMPKANTCTAINNQTPSINA
jgi:Adenylylsulfate kinase and related kinases